MTQNGPQPSREGGVSATALRMPTITPWLRPTRSNPRCDAPAAQAVAYMREISGSELAACWARAKIAQAARLESKKTPPPIEAGSPPTAPAYAPRRDLAAPSHGHPRHQRRYAQSKTTVAWHEPQRAATIPEPSPQHDRRINGTIAAWRQTRRAMNTIQHLQGQDHPTCALQAGQQVQHLRFTAICPASS